MDIRQATPKAAEYLDRKAEAIGAHGWTVRNGGRRYLADVMVIDRESAWVEPRRAAEGMGASICAEGVVLDAEDNTWAFCHDGEWAAVWWIDSSGRVG